MLIGALEAALASDEAGAFIARSEPIVNAAINAKNIVERRRQIRAEIAPASERAIVRHHVTTSEEVIGGIRCQIVLARDQPPDRLRRTVLYCFGGGYVLGSPFEDLPITAALAEWTGARIVVPHYRLAPEYPYPAPIEDGMAVYRALVGDMRSGPLAVAGESAGGNMALSIVHRARLGRLPLPCAVALLSPWCDLTNSGDSITANDGRDPTLNRFQLDEFARVYVGSADRCAVDVSPLFGPFDAAWPPTIITTGTRDLLLSQCVRLSQLIARAGARADLRVWDGMWHVFEFYDEIPEALLSLRQIAEFLNAPFTAADNG